MDRLRSPDGCPWDAEQTHVSLRKYLLEEAYEAVDAIDSGDLSHVREELGDVLLQVLFHARIAQEHPEPFDIDDIAHTLADKLERRHPHVFADTTVAGPTEVETNWDAIKAAEKDRTGLYDEVLTGQSALALAAAVLRRADRGGVKLAVSVSDAQSAYGAELLEVVRRAGVAGVDAELALRQVLIRAINVS